MDRATMLLNRAFADILAGHHDRMREAAERDPVKNKLTMIWPNGQEPSWRYYGGGVDRRGVSYRFCWTTNRNAAGYFLSFVERFDRKKGRGERVKFLASRSRSRMKARALKLYQAHQKRRSRK